MEEVEIMKTRLMSRVVLTPIPRCRVSRRVALVSVGVLALLVTTVTAAASTGSWTQVSPATSPSARYSEAMATDPSGNAVLFGGNGATLALGDTWLWNGTSWSHPALSYWAVWTWGGCGRY